MKFFLSALLFIILAKASSAQSELLSFDEHNKYIYYQVVEIPGLPADTLHSRCMVFLKKGYPNIKLKTNNLNDLNAYGEFLTYGGISVLRHEKGSISYTLNIEFKDQKYRYWLTSFIFTPYQRDRYGNFVPKVGINIPLETALSKLDKKDVDNYLNETGSFCKQFGESLKQNIIKALTPKNVEITKKTVPDKW